MISSDLTHVSVMALQFLALRSAEAHIKVPPHAATLLQAIYSPRFFREMPPVGMNLTFAKGPASALIFARPPLCSAGKNLTTSSPS